MPIPRPGEERDDFIERCIPIVIEDGTAKDGRQGAAVCHSMWKEAMAEKSDITKAEWTRKFINDLPDSSFLFIAAGGEKDEDGKTTPRALRKFPYRDSGGAVDLPHLRNAIARIPQSNAPGLTAAKKVSLQEKARRILEKEQAKSRLMLSMLMTKAERMGDGRVRWQARANSGNFDLVNERFDRSFWQDVTKNFAVQQEAISRGEFPPDPLPLPILDPAHYSLKTDPRSIARGGYPIKVWVDGNALMAQGYFDDSPLGRAMAKAAESRPVKDRRVSICVFPDWGNVERSDDKTTYKGGRGIAYLDHLAMTSMPMDPDTAIAVKSEVAMTTQKDDALAVLGDEAAELVDQLEAAKTKTATDGVLIKAEDEEATDADEPETEDAETTKDTTPDAEPVEEEPETSEPEPKSMTVEDFKGVLSAVVTSLGESIEKRLAPLEEIPGRLDAMDSRIKALAADESEKVKAAIDGNGQWWERLTKAIGESSVQRHGSVEDGTAKGPVETSEHADYRSKFTPPPNQGE